MRPGEPFIARQRVQDRDRLLRGALEIIEADAPLHVALRELFAGGRVDVLAQLLESVVTGADLLTFYEAQAGSELALPLTGHAFAFRIVIIRAKMLVQIRRTVPDFCHREHEREIYEVCSPAACKA